MINITPLAEIGKIELEEREYNRLVKKVDQGWTSTGDEKEFLAKLHYLRVGLAENKAPRAELLTREEALMTKFWLKAL